MSALWSIFALVWFAFLMWGGFYLSERTNEVMSILLAALK